MIDLYKKNSGNIILNLKLDDDFPNNSIEIDLPTYCVNYDIDEFYNITLNYNINNPTCMNQFVNILNIIRYYSNNMLKLPANCSVKYSDNDGSFFIYDKCDSIIIPIISTDMNNSISINFDIYRT